jgi:Ca-activated chloride channel family protein
MWGYVAAGLVTFFSAAAGVLALLLWNSGALRFAEGRLAWALLLIPALVVLLVLYVRAQKRDRARLGTDANLEPLLPRPDPGKALFRNAALACAAAFAVLALLGPRMGTKLETVQRKGVDIFLVVDVSKSMDADDLKPSRLRRAVMEIEVFLEGLEGNRVGLVAFAGDAFVQCPLTLDYAAARIFLDILDTSLISVPGTDIGRAMERTLEGFGTKERTSKVIILFTDGEDHGGQAEAMAKKAAEEGIILYAIGIGSPEGSIIPLRDARGQVTEYKKDEEGRVVTSRLGEETLQKMVLSTGGKYYRSTSGNMELKRILEDIRKMEKKDLGSAQMTRFEDRFQYALLPGFLLFALAAFLALPWRQQ